MLIKRIIEYCTQCPYFCPGHNDPQCLHPSNLEAKHHDLVYPNTGATYGWLTGVYVKDGPPSNCPIRETGLTMEYKVL